MLTNLSFNSDRSLLFVVLTVIIVHCDGEFDKVAENNVYLKYLYQKYGSDHNVLTFEGLEHLLGNLNLGGLEFDKQHSIVNHRPKDYQLPEVPVYNATSAQMSSSFLANNPLIKNSSNSKRESPDTDIRPSDEETNNTFIPLHGMDHNHRLHRKQYLHDTCLSPLAFAEIVYNRDAKAAQYLTVDSILITPRSFLELCPALLVQIEQKACESVTAQQQEHAKHTTDHGDANHSQSPRAWLYASCSIFLISICGVFGIVLVPLAELRLYDKILRFLVALATGTLCGDALMHLLPHILISHDHQPVEDTHYLCGFVFLSAFSMYFLEKMLVLARYDAGYQHGHSHGHQHHHHHHHHHNHNDHQVESVNVQEANKVGGEQSDVEQAPRETRQLNNEQLTDEKENISHIIFMVVLGDGIHNFTDGLAIGAAFSVDIVGGMAISLAVLLHELPHELGDIALLLKTGMSIKRAMYLNLLSSVISFIGMVIGLLLVGYHAYLVRWIYAATAGIFMYIALCDLLPEIGEGAKKSLKNTLIYFGGILLGGGIMLLIAEYEESLEALFGG